MLHVQSRWPGPDRVDRGLDWATGSTGQVPGSYVLTTR